MNITTERTAEILVSRYGAQALDFAARQLAIFDLADATKTAAEWKSIALAIEQLQTKARPGQSPS